MTQGLFAALTERAFVIQGDTSIFLSVQNLHKPLAMFVLGMP